MFNLEHFIQNKTRRELGFLFRKEGTDIEAIFKHFLETRGFINQSLDDAVRQLDKLVIFQTSLSRELCILRLLTWRLGDVLSATQLRWQSWKYL